MALTSQILSLKSADNTVSEILGSRKATANHFRKVRKYYILLVSFHPILKLGRVWV